MRIVLFQGLFHKGYCTHLAPETCHTDIKDSAVHTLITHRNKESREKHKTGSVVVKGKHIKNWNPWENIK